MGTSRGLLTRTLQFSGLMLFLHATTSFAADDALVTALKNGQASLDMRLRYEQVDADVTNPPANQDEAEGLTVRTRLGYRSAALHGFTVFGEFEDTHVVLGVDDYTPETAGYATIADPRVTELNQSWIRYSGSDSLKGFAATYGRQRIILDNARFVGNVGWRQDEQTFDASRLDYDREAFALMAAYITKVNGITPGFDAFADTTLVNARWKQAPGGVLTAYGYFIEPEYTGDYDSTDTAGLRYQGSVATDLAKLLLTLEYAEQRRDPAAGGSRNDVEYRFAELGAVVSGVTVKVAQEVLGSDDGVYGFQTALATKHAFNGWADQFLVTPANGLEDTFVTVSGSLGGVALMARYHDFAANEGNADYGDEVDLSASRKFGAYTLGLKYADYDAETVSVDTQKFWLWGELKF